MPKTIMKTLGRRRIEAMVVLIGIAGYIWKGFDLPGYFHSPGVPSPSVFPAFLGIVMGLAAIWQFFFPGQEKKKVSESAIDPKELATEKRQFYLMWGLLVGYLILLPYLGFIISSSFLLTGFIMMLGEKKFKKAVIIAITYNLVLFFLFNKLLQVRLPAWIIENMLR